MNEYMRLKILLPFQVFLDQDRVTRIVAESQKGAFGLLPNRLDYVAALAPGVFVYETEAAGETFIAVDEGVLVKAGADVLVSVRNAVGGADLGDLRKAVEKHFHTRDEREQGVRYSLAKLESQFVRRMMEYSRHG
jgi:F-type H+-transporting ATPase subunit epsilon